jgi:hypothetical protein
MSTFEGRGYVEELGEFRPAPALLSQGLWREVWDLVSGKSDDHGRSGPAALAARLRTIAGEAAYEAAFRRVGWRWRSMTDREWFEFVMNDALEDVRAAYRCGTPRTEEEYVALQHAYRAAYAWLAAALLAWAEAIEARKRHEEGKEDERGRKSSR